MLTQREQSAFGPAFRSALLRSSTILPVALSVFSAQSAHAQAVNLGNARANFIVPDGRTQTTLSSGGAGVTNIATSTMSGGNAFNTFTNFKVARGNIVNLYVPSAANNLVNVVTQAPVDIEGTLNSFKNGALGGNIVFADSYGFVVGRAGVINVGSLTISTASQATLDKLVSANGTINSALASQLIHGDVPLSSDGSVVIRGEIIAQHGVRIDAHDVLVAGSLPAAEKAARQRALFESSVNAGGLREGGAIVVRDGGIEIVAAHNVDIQGRLVAGGKAHQGGAVSISARADFTLGASGRIVAKAARNAPSASGASARISISAGGDAAIAGQIVANGTVAEAAGAIKIAAGDISVAGTALLAAAGAGAGSDGGSIKIDATNNLSVADGARFSVAAGSSGDAGEVDLSAIGTATIGAIEVDLSAADGKSGTLDIDPTDLVIGSVDPSAPSDASFDANMVTLGGSVDLSATNSITIARDGIIDTTKSGGQSGSIELTAPTISILGGGQLLADAVGAGGIAGDITLTATAASTSAAPATTAAQISIGETGEPPAVVAGGAVAISASSTLGQAYDHAAILIQSSDVTAAGAMQLTATASGGTTVNSIGASASADVRASVDILGSSHVTSTGAMTLSAGATSIASATGALPASVSLPADASAAVTTVTSVASVHIGGSSSVSTTGAGSALNMAATNAVTSGALADATGASVGASVAVNVVTATTTASIDGSATVNSAGAVGLSAISTTNLTTSAKSSSGGAASTPDSGSTASQYLNDSKYEPYESTSDGKVGAAGALTISDLTAMTAAQMSSTVQAVAGGALSLTSGALNSASSVADASNTSGGTGIGAALALNLAHVASNATLAQSAQSVGASLTADNTGTAAQNAFTTQATSGAGATNVGVAGSLSTTLLDSQSAATVGSGASLALGGGDLTLQSNNLSSSLVSALPSGTGASGGKVGVGASIALNIVSTRSEAELLDGTTLTGAGSVSLSADATHVAATQADQGSAGGVAVTPVVALSLIDDATQASIGALTGGLVSTGGVSVTALQLSSVGTEASGTAAGGSAAVGAALALGIVDDSVLATTSTSVSALGSVSFAASGASLSVASATASASGGKAANSDGSAPSGEDSSVDSKIQKQSSEATGKASSADVGDSTQQSADGSNASSENGQGSTSDGSVAVAAAIAVEVAQSNVQAYAPASVGISAGTSLSVTSVDNADARTIADGSQVGTAGTSGPSVGIGAAVAITLAHSENSAELGAPSALSGSPTTGTLTAGSYHAGSLTVTALQTDLGLASPGIPGSSAAGPASVDMPLGREDLYSASAMSGAGASNVGVAGSLALDLVDSSSMAEVAAGVTTIVPAGGGSVTLSSDDETSSLVSALPSGTGASGGKVGVGASIALNIVSTRSEAELLDGTTLTGAGSVSLSADATHVAATQADQGSAGGVAVTPVVALSLIDDATQASIGALTGGLVSTGGVSVTALQLSSVGTEASGTAAGGSAAVGAALALGIVDDSVLATTSTSVSALGSVSFAASGASLSVASATASASGGNGTNSSGGSSDGDSSVDSKIQKQSSDATGKASSADVGDSSQQSADLSDAASENGKGSTNEGAVTVAAAIAVEVAKSNVQAYVPIGVSVSAKGELKVATVNNADGEATADGSAVGSASSSGGSGSGSSGGSSGTKVSIGAAVAIGLVDVVNDATLGATSSLSTPTTIAGTSPGQYSAQSVSVTALNSDLGLTTPAIPGSTTSPPAVTDSSVDDGRPDQFVTSATSGASGTNIGLAGALAANIIFSDSSASIANAASVTLVAGGVGTVTIASDNELSASATAAPTSGGASGGKLGVGASVALNTITQSSTATLGQGVSLSGTAASLDVLANSTANTASASSGGASGGTAVDAVVALSVLTETTSAVVDSGGGISVSGDVDVAAVSGGTNTAIAFGKTDTSGGGSGSSSGSSSGGGSSGVGVGASVAVITGAGVLNPASSGDIDTSSTTASLDRDVDAGGDLTVSAATTRTYDAESTAIAGGAVFSSAMSNGDAQTSGGGSAVSVDALNSSQAQGAMSQEQSAMGSGSGGKLSVAAAIGAAIVQDQVTAEILGGASGADQTLTVGGAVKVSATSDGDVLTLGDGATVGNQKVGIGIGAALSILDNSTTASIGQHTHIVTPGAVSVLATSTENQDAGFADRLSAEAMSGATASKIAVAGALAIGISTSSTAASIGDNVAIDKAGDSVAQAGALNVTADNTSELAAKAWAGSFSGQGSGVGASIAVVISTDGYSAEIGQSDTINAASVSVQATNEKVDNTLSTISTLISMVDADAGSDSSTFGSDTSSDAAAVLAQLKQVGSTAQNEPLLGQNNYYTEVIAGAASGSQVSFAGGFAIQVIDNSTTARIGSNSTIESSGSVSAESADDAGSKTLVGALSASAGTTAAGISSAIITNSSSVTSSIGDGSTIPKSSSVAVKAEASQDIDVFELSAAAGDENGAAGILGAITSLTSVTASVGQGATIKSTGAVDISAANTIGVLDIAGAIGLGGENGLGGTAVATTIKDSANAYVDSAQADATTINAGAFGATGATSENLINVAIAGAVAGEDGFAGVATPLTQIVTSQAYVGPNATIETTSAANIMASDGTQVVNVGGAVAGGGSTAVGGTAAVTSIINDIYAYLGAGSQATVGSLDISATGSQQAVNVAIAGTAGGNNAVSGVLTPVTQFMNVLAYTGQDVTIGARSGDVDVEAQDTTRIINAGGVVAVGGDNGVGGSAAVSTLSDMTEAYVGDGSAIDALGAVVVSALASEDVTTAVVSGSAGGDVGASVALSSSIIIDTTEAYVGHAVTIGASTEPSSVSVNAQDTSAIFDIAGTLGVGGSVGVGAGADVNVLTKNTFAWIGRDNSTETLTPQDAASVKVSGGDVTVDAQSSENVYSIVAGFGVGGDAGVAGSVAVYALNGSTLAGIGDDDMVDATGNVAVLAGDRDTINRIAGSGAVGGDAGVGAAIGVTVAIQTTQATIGAGATVVALGEDPSFDATTGFSGSFSVYGAQATASVLPPASNLTGTVGAEIDPTSIGDALSEGASLLTLDRTTTPIEDQIHGVVVNATATNFIRSLSVSGAAGGAVAVTISGDVPVVVSDTEAGIGAGAKINTTGAANSAQSIVVAAASDLYHLGITGSAAGAGAVGVGAGAETNIFDNITIASVGQGATVDAAENVDVTSKASEDFAGASASAGLGGDVGVAGGVTGFVVTDVTKAYIDSAAGAVSSIDAGGSVVVAADDETRAITVSGTLAVGVGTAGVGAGVGITVITKDTEAYVGTDADVTALGAGSDANFAAYVDAGSANTTAGQGLLVQANSGESLMSDVLAGAGGLFAGVAGVVSVEAISAKTEAYIDGGATINGADAGANPNQDVDVAARDSTVVSAVDGVAGIGVAGVGGAVDLAIIANTTDAFIGDGSTVNAANDVLVNALTNQATSSTVASIAGGIGGFSAAISVLAIANGPSADQSSQTTTSGGKTVSGNANSELQDNSINSGFLSESTNSNVTSTSAKAQSYKSNLTTSSIAGGTYIPSGTSATIGSATIQAGGAVAAETQDDVNAIVADGALAATIGLGAGIGVTTVNVDNAATIATGANITAGSVDVSASSQRTFSSVGLAATAVGVAAAAMTVEDSTTTTAQVDASSVSARGGVNVDAQNLITATVLTTSVAAGTAGGLDLLALTPSTTATIGADSRVSSGTGAAGGDVTVDADSTITLPTLPFSGANAAVIGGVGAGVTIAVLTPTTDASIGDGADVTAGAAQGGSQPSLGSVTVDATSAETLFTEGAGLSIGGYAGGALTVYVLTGGATAEIGAATVTATGNVAAQASNSVSGDILVGGFAAGGVSGGGALGVSVIDTTTSASIDANANVTAYALGSSGVGYVESYDGTFTSYVAGSSILPASLPNVGSSSADPEDPLTTGDVTSAGEDLLLEERNSSPVNANASGVVVAAANADTVRTISVSGALGGAAIALSVDAPIVISTTKATIGASASINKQTAFTAGADQSVVVAAANDFYSLGVAGSVAGGVAAGLGAGFIATSVQATTTATIGAGAKVAAAADVGVSAEGREDFATMAASAGAGGALAVTGGISVLVLNDTTTALIDQNANVVAANDVSVIADDETRAATVAGALAVGLGGAVGGSVSVAVVNKDTEATIAGDAAVTGEGKGSDSFTEYTDSGPNPFSMTQHGHGVLVEANSAESFYTISVAGVAGAVVGAAGAISVQVVTDKTLAAVDDGAMINTVGTGGADQDLAVAGRDSTGIVSTDGSVGGGLIGGLSGSVDVGVATTTVGASIGDGATVDAARDVSVDALANKAISSTVVSAAAGGAALAAGVSVYSIGNGVDPSGKGASELQPSSGPDIVTYAGGQASSGGVVSQSVDATSSNANVQSAASSVNSDFGSVGVSGDVYTNAAVAGTSATIGSAAITAGASVSVGALDDLNSGATTGALGVGLAGIGAGIGVVSDSATTTASIAGVSTIAAHDVSVAAVSNHTIAVTSFAGAVALVVGAEADVAVETDSSTTNASISGVTIVAPGSISVDASETRALTASGSGIAVAGDLAVGVSIATATLTGGAQADIGTVPVVGGSVQGASIGSIGNAVGTVTVDATSTDSAAANALAVAGGIGIAADGAVATASATPLVSTYLDGGSIVASSQIGLRSDGEDSASASASGLSFAVVGAAGASIANATVAPDATAVVRDGSNLNAGSLEVDAWVGQASSTPTVVASASGTSGAVFVGINATSADAQNDSQAIASAEDSTLTTTGATTFQGLSTTSQSSNATGIAAAGLLAVGFDQSTASSDTTTQATFANVGNITAGALTLNANGSDSNNATATAGSGGLIAGSAASATTFASGVTDATIDNGSTTPIMINVAGGNVNILATHTANFSGSVDSTQAAVVGASGATLTHTVSNMVDAHLGQYIDLVATNLTIDAQNYAHNYFTGEPVFGLYPGDVAKSTTYDSDDASWNVNSGSGGLINAPAGASYVTVTLTTNASIGDYSNVHLLAPATPGDVSILFVEAYNEAIVHQKVQMDSGGAVALAEAAATVTVVDTASVSFGDHSSSVVDIGNVEAGAWGNADIDVNVAATTYGLAGAPSGKGYANVTAINTLYVGVDTRVEASDGIDPVDGTAPTYGEVMLAAGDSPTGLQSSLTLYAEANLFNNTIIPISGAPDAQSNVIATSTVTIEGEPDQVTNAPNPADDTHYGINAAGDITISADQGQLSTTATGVGKNIYLEALSEAASAISNLFGGGSITFDITGGSTSQSGSSSLLIDGEVDTGVQRNKTLTISYATADTAPNAYSAGSCDITGAACLAPPTNGEIPATVSGPYPVGEAILSRLQTLQSLLLAYGDDPIASGAYQSEITFLENELVGLGLGSFQGGQFVAGAYAGAPALQAQYQNQLNSDQGTLTLVANALAAQAAAVLPIGDGDVASAINLIVNDTYGVVNSANAAVQTIKGFANYAFETGSTTANGVTTNNDQTFLNDASDVTQQTGNIRTYANNVNSESANNTTAQTDINSQTQIIISASQDMSAVPSDATADQQKIATASGAISADMSDISSNISGEQSNATALSGSINSIFTNLNYMANHAAGSANSGALATLIAVPTSPNGSNSIGNISLAQTAISSQLTAIASDLSAVQTAQANLTNNSSSTTLTINQPIIRSVTQYVSLLNTYNGAVASDNANLANLSANPPASPVTYYIEVPNTVARLGNIALNAQTVASPDGTGELLAPGNASISITNNTADTLDLSSLVIPSYDAGYLRVNGVIVNSPGDITALNAGGAPSNFASNNLVTAANSGSLPTITITSNYNPNDVSYYNPSAPPGSPYYLTHQQVAPDIILKSGSAIDNLNGSVTIFSAAGNIYQQGTIDAGQVSITAANGDFVTSYVDGIDNIGSDPASHMAPGAGITANGEVYIAARYININSTIQSGIANWSLNIAAGDSLTSSDPTLIGVSQSVVDGLVSAYQQAVLTNPSTPSTTSTVNSIGQSITINLATGQVLFSTAQADTYYQSQGGGGVYQLVSPGSNIGANFDVATQEYVVNSTEVHGGYIQLYGQIMDTSPTSGQLNVLDGFGTISVTNTTDLPVVLSALSTGSDTSGTLRGTSGVIDITDVHLDYAANPNSATPNQVDVTHTVYTRSYDPTDPTGSGDIIEQQQYGILNSQGIAVYTGALADVSTTAGRSASYDPLAGQRYVWTTATVYSAVSYFQHDETTVFGNSNWNFDGVDSLDFTSPAVPGAPTPLPNGVYITTDITQTSTAGTGLNNMGIVLDNSPSTTTNGSLENTALVTSTFNYLDNYNVKYLRSHSSCDWYTLCIAQDKTIYYEFDQTYTEITTNSQKADYAIGVNFIGSNTGSISVQSSGNVVLTGAITNASGLVSISATGGSTASIIEGSNAALITSENISLSASKSVGGVSDPNNPAAPAKAPVAVTLTQAVDHGVTLSGSLSASASEGNVDVSATDNLTIGTVTAVGDVTQELGQVTLSAVGSLTGVNANAYVQADEVNLSAQNGSIAGYGGARNGLLVDTGYTDDQTLRPFGDPAQNPALNVNPYYGLQALSAGDINIVSGKWTDNVEGTILVDTVVSSGGNVTLTSPGQILDNNPVQTVDTRTYQQLVGYWNSLALTASAANTAKQTATIAAYQQSITQEYDQYWQIRDSQPDGGAAYNPNFTITIAPGSQEYQALTEQYTNQILATQPNLTQAQINTQVSQDISTFETAQTAQYQTLNGEVGSLTAKYQPGYQYVATAAQESSLTAGAVWTTDELAFSFSAGVLKTVTNTNPVVKSPNVSGRTVTINAAMGVGETIVEPGQSEPGIIIPAGIAPSALTDDQKVALAAAEASDLGLTIGSIQLPAGETFNQLTAAQQAAYTAAAGLTNITIPLGDDPSTLDAAQQAALQAAALGLANLNGSYLTVLVKRPLNFSAATALNVTVTQAPNGTIDIGDAYLASQGNALLGNISVPGETRIKVIGSIGNAASASLVQTGNIILEAANGDIGGVPPVGGSLLDLSPLNNATITARAENGVDISVAAVNVGDTNNANVATIYSPQDVTLTAQGSIVDANDDELINILGADVRLKAVTGSIGSVGDTLNVAVISNGGIYATAATPGASVDLYGPSGNSFTIENVIAGGSAALTAAGDGTIDGDVFTGAEVDMSAGGRLVLTQNADVVPSTGGVSIDAASLKMLNGAIVDAALGDIDIDTSGDALVTGLVSGSADAQAVSIISGGHVLAGTNPNRVDITAITPGAGVSISAALGIGDETEADSEATDAPNEAPGTANLITATPNPLIIKTASIYSSSAAGDVDVTSAAAVTSGTVSAANGSVNITALQNFSVGSISTPLGNIDLQGAGAIILPKLSAGLGIGASEGQIIVNAGATLTVGTATSGGSQNLTAVGNLTFTQLTTTGIPGDPGNVDPTSTTGAVTGGNIDANGGVDIHGAAAVALDDVMATQGPVVIVSGSRLTGKSLTTGGSASLTSTGAQNWTTLNVGTTLTADSTNGALTLGTATSGGSQNLSALGGLTFTQLTTTGIPGDPGNVDLTSTSGAVTGGDIDANGGVDIHGASVALDDVTAPLGPVLIVSGSTLTGNSLTTGGSASLTSTGAQNWTTLNVGTMLTADSTDGALTLGTATSGGSQTLEAQGNLTFTQLTTTGIPGDPGNVDLRSFGGGIQGNSVTVNGALDADALGPISIANILALASIQVSSGTSVTLGDVMTGSGTNFFSPIVKIGVLSPAPGVTSPFEFSIAGPGGSVGTYASVMVHSPFPVVMGELREDSAIIATDATSFAIDNGYIFDTLSLTTPFQTLYMNNQSPEPINNIGVQLYAQDYAFQFSQNNFRTTTTSFVVQYDLLAEIVDELPGGTILGASFLRDFDRMGWLGDPELTPSADQFGLPSVYGPWPSAPIVGWPSVLPGPQGVPAVNLFVGDETWLLVSGPDGLSIDIRRRRKKTIEQSNVY